MPADTRTLAARVAVIARRFDAIASGQRKQSAGLIESAKNYEREAATLHEAARALEGK